MASQEKAKEKEYTMFKTTRIRIPAPRIPRRRPLFDIVGNDEFVRMMDLLFGDVPKEDEEGGEEKVVRIPIHDIEKKNADDGDFDIKWVVEDGDDEDEDEEDEKVPPSIFDMLSSGREFKDIVSSSRHTDLYNQAFHLDEDGKPLPLPDEKPMKNPFVFIANRLTFLIKTRMPIIWDTSTIMPVDENVLFVAFDQEKNPHLDFKQASRHAHVANTDSEIRDEILDFVEGTGWSYIYCSPYVLDVKGEKRLGFAFSVVPECRD